MVYTKEFICSSIHFLEANGICILSKALPTKEQAILPDETMSIEAGSAVIQWR